MPERSDESRNPRFAIRHSAFGIAGSSRLAFRSLAAVTNKEFIHIIRDPGTLFISLIIPVFLLLLFGYALSLDIRNVPFGLVDNDRTQQSREFIEKFSASGYFQPAGAAQSEPELRAAIDAGRCRIGFVIPTGFSRDLAAGRSPGVGILIDGSNSFTASVIIAYTQSVMARDTRLASLALRPRVLFNPTQRSTNYLVPGLLAIITMFMTILLPSLAVVREKERGTIEILRAGPIRPAAFIFGKLLPYGLICLFDLFTVIIAGTLVFGVPLQGSFLLLVILSLPFLVTGLAMGLFISTFVESLQVAMYVSFLSSVLPTFLLAGFVFPIASMPKVVQLVTWLVPARYFLVAIRGIYLKAATLQSLTQPLLIILLMGTVLIILAIERLRRTL
jgi:ABC-2 type transport system permease protein